MSKFTLSNIHDISNSKVTHEFEAETLDDVLMYMESFLRGCGFQFDGCLTTSGDKPVEYECATLLLEQ